MPEEKRTLRDITTDYTLLNRTIEEARELGATEEEIAAKIEAAVDLIEGEFDEKVERIAQLVLEDEHSAAGCKAEVDRLLARHKRYSTRVKWFKQYLHHCLTAADRKKVEGKLLTISLRKAPVSCVILDAAKVPEGFQRVVPEKVEVDKQALIKHYKASGEIPAGVDFLEDKTTLRIT